MDGSLLWDTERRWENARGAQDGMQRRKCSRGLGENLAESSMSFFRDDSASCHENSVGIEAVCYVLAVWNMSTLVPTALLLCTQRVLARTDSHEACMNVPYVSLWYSSCSSALNMPDTWLTLMVLGNVQF